MGIGEQFEFEKTGQIEAESAMSAMTQEGTLTRAKTFIGKPLVELEAAAIKFGGSVRVARKNGKNTCLTCDYRPWRINVEVQDDIVLAIYDIG